MKLSNNSSFTASFKSACVAQGLPLDTYAKSAAIQQKCASPGLGYSRKWELQRRARYAVGGRVSRCRRIPLKGGDVQLWRHFRGTASFAGLETCGSVWSCPCCSSKISEVRRGELQLAVERHRANGGNVALLTLTVAHSPFDPLAQILAQLTEAYRSASSCRGWKAALNGSLGSVRAIEVTHGQNGWHPHFHVLLFLPQSIDLGALRRDLWAQWSAAVQRVGGTVSRKAFRLHDGRAAAGYVSKFGREWGLSDELVHAQRKQGRRGSRTPWDLLRDGDSASLALFRHYSEVFRGRRQLVWSRGLREALAVQVEQSDEDVVQAPSGEGDSLLVSFDAFTWRRIVKLQSEHLILEVAAQFPDSLTEFLSELLGSRAEAQRPLTPSTHASWSLGQGSSLTPA